MSPPGELKKLLKVQPRGSLNIVRLKDFFELNCGPVNVLSKLDPSNTVDFQQCENSCYYVCIFQDNLGGECASALSGTRIDGGVVTVSSAADIDVPISTEKESPEEHFYEKSNKLSDSLGQAHTIDITPTVGSRLLKSLFKKTKSVTEGENTAANDSKALDVADFQRDNLSLANRIEAARIDATSVLRCQDDRLHALESILSRLEEGSYALEVIE